MSEAPRDRTGLSFIREVVSIAKVISRNSQPSLSRGKLHLLREIARQPTCGAGVRIGSHGISAGRGSEEELGAGE